MIGLVTGGSRGIGRATAIELAKRGFDVVVNYRSDEAAARETAAAIEGIGRRAKAVRADVSRIGEVAAMFGEVDAFGPIDVLVCNAGITRDTLLGASEPRDFGDVMPRASGRA